MITWYSKYRYFRIFLQVLALVLVVKIVFDYFIVKKKIDSEITTSYKSDDFAQIDFSNNWNNFTISRNENNWYLNAGLISEKIETMQIDTILLLLSNLSSNKIISLPRGIHSKCNIQLIDKNGKISKLEFMKIAESYYLTNKNNTFSLINKDLSFLFDLKTNDIRNQSVLKMKFDSIVKISFNGNSSCLLTKKVNNWQKNHQSISDSLLQTISSFMDLKSNLFYDTEINDSIRSTYKITFHDTNDSISLTFYQLDSNKCVMKSSQRLYTAFVASDSLINDCKFIENQCSTK